MSNTTHRDRAQQNNLSTSRATDDASTVVAAILAVDPRADSRSDKATEIANESPTAPLAHVSRRGLIMNSIVSAAAVATATAIPNENVASASTVPHTVSFPDLVARLIRIRERWSAQQASDAAYSKKIDQLFFEATGVSFEKFRESDGQSERGKQLNEVSNRIFRENPDENNPHDKHGVSIVWSEINDEMLDVASDILSRHPLSVADLAWQAEAIVLAEVNLPDTIVDVPLLPKLFENIRMLAGPLPIPAVMLPVPAPKSDPIFALIDAHKRAYDAFSDHLLRQDDLEKSIPKERRRTDFDYFAHDYDEECLIATDDPAWLAYTREYEVRHEAEERASIDLLSVEDLTPAGAIALLEYAAYRNGRGDSWPELENEKGEPHTWEGWLLQQLAGALQSWPT